MLDNAELANKNNKKEIVCENCHAIVTGPYCGQCGQSVESTLRYFWSVLLHLLDDIFSFDSRASRTLRPLMLSPGFLTNEYVQGRRVHYVPPLRLYLFISIVFFISLKFFAVTDNDDLVYKQRTESMQSQITQHISNLETSQPTLSTEQKNLQLEQINRLKQYQRDLSTNVPNDIANVTALMAEITLAAIEENEPLSKSDKRKLTKLAEKLAALKAGEPAIINDKILSIGNNVDGSFSLDFLSAETNFHLNKKIKQLEEKARQAFNSDARPIVQQSISKLPQLMFILLPLFALLLKLLYLFSNRLYMEHLTVALHSHSFIFLTFLLVSVSDALQAHLLVSLPMISSAFGYLAIALITWLPIYLFIMQRRVYRQGYLLTTIKFCVIGLIYMQLIGVTAIIAFIWGLADS